jgi:predicted DNA-binding transcriptional regulator YafY
MSSSVIINPASSTLFVKANRLLSALLLLQAHGKLPGRALAERLDVSMRTVHRDMEALSAAGVPVFALRGAQGGWQLDEDWRTRVPGLDEAELRALLMAQPRMLGDAQLAASAERALTKLMAALPVSLRERATFLRQRIYVDASGWRGTVENVAALPNVQDAVSRDRTLKIAYRQTGRERVNRTVHPLGLVAKGTTWYLVASTPNGFRTYRVSRIEEVTVLDTRFERPADFDLAAYWKASTEQFNRRRRYVATLRLEPQAADSMRTWCAVLPTSPAESPDPAGWVTLRVQFDHEADACFIVLGLGAQVDVIEPASLRARVKADVAAAFERLHLSGRSRTIGPRHEARFNRGKSVR